MKSLKDPIWTGPQMQLARELNSDFSGSGLRLHAAACDVLRYVERRIVSFVRHPIKEQLDAQEVWKTPEWF